MNLLLRFYDPQGGDITLDGNSIKSLNIRYLRSQLGYVGQEPVLFTGTVADNIAYGIPPSIAVNLSPAEIRAKVVEASKLANAHDFISSFPSGYDTDVGSAGVAMSGGQKQRIAIARALVKKPAVLLLDEATSALDTASERIVQESIDKLQESKAQTTIVIAHRLSTIRNADKIAVVNNGVIAELGTHQDLYALGGVYKELVSMQVTGTDELEDGPTVDTMKVEVKRSSLTDDDSRDLGNAQVLETATVIKSDVLDGKQKLEGEEATVISVAMAKEESTRLSRMIWGVVLEHKLWLFLAFLGALIFGAVFPLWGYLLAKTQALFYYSDPDRIRSAAGNVALYFILLGIGCQVSSILQFGGIAQVGERVSMRLRGLCLSSL
jgi:ATP-binding cassette subfamily B (MDR/TAP) protein 1